jgi:hypothetical protein
MVSTNDRGIEKSVHIWKAVTLKVTTPIKLMYIVFYSVGSVI